MTAPNFAQVVGSGSVGSAATIAVAPAAGNTLICVVKGPSSAVVTAASDSRGNTYIVDVINATGTNTISIIRAYMTTPLLVNDTVSFTMSAGTASFSQVYEYRGMLVASTPLDAITAKGGSSISNLTTSAITPQDANDILISGFTINTNTSTITRPSGYTHQGTAFNGTGFTVDLVDKVAGSIGSNTVTWSWTGTFNAAVALAAYRPLAPSGGLPLLGVG